MRIAAAIKKNQEFDPNTFLATIGGGRKILSVARKKRSSHKGGCGLRFLYSKRKEETHGRIHDRQGSNETLAEMVGTLPSEKVLRRQSHRFRPWPRLSIANRSKTAPQKC